jgi:hypothetical protein
VFIQSWNCEGCVLTRPAGDAGRPADQGGHADAAFPDVAFDAVERAVAAEEARVLGERAAGTRLVVRAVVGGEDHQGVVVDFEVREQLQQIAHGVVDAADHGGVAFGGAGQATSAVPGLLS